MRSLPAHFWLWGCAGVGLVADLWSKSWAFRELSPDASREFVPGLLVLQLSLNPGALFGFGPGKVALFVVASLAALVFVLCLFASSAPRQRGVHVALALILSGALGNLYDRLFNRVDMLELRVEAGQESPRLLGELLEDPAEGPLLFRSWGRNRVAQTMNPADVARITRDVGAVRDFLKIKPRIFGRSVWPWVFNVADVLLVAGVALLLLGSWRAACRTGRPMDSPGAAAAA